MGACLAAEEAVFTTQIHPYIFIDQTQVAQLSPFRLFVEILGDFRIAYNNEGMKGIIIPESEFLKAFTVLERKKFVLKATPKYADTKSNLSGNGHSYRLCIQISNSELKNDHQ